VRVVDAASLEGFFKSMKYKVRRFPAIIVEGKVRFIDGDFEGAGDAIAESLGRGETIRGSKPQRPGSKRR
jgi:hypothetical protein